MQKIRIICDIAEWTSTVYNNFIRFEIFKNILENSYEYYQGTKTEECKLVQMEERHHLFFLIDEKYYRPLLLNNTIKDNYLNIY